MNVTNFESSWDFFPNTNMIIKWRNDTYNITSTPEIDDVRVQKFYSFIISK